MAFWERSVVHILTAGRLHSPFAAVTAMNRVFAASKKSGTGKPRPGTQWAGGYKHCTMHMYPPIHRIPPIKTQAQPQVYTNMYPLLSLQTSNSNEALEAEPSKRWKLNFG